jgi:hypothetical protein
MFQHTRHVSVKQVESTHTDRDQKNRFQKFEHCDQPQQPAIGGFHGPEPSYPNSDARESPLAMDRSRAPITLTTLLRICEALEVRLAKMVAGSNRESKN